MTDKAIVWTSAGAAVVSLSEWHAASPQAPGGFARYAGVLARPGQGSERIELLLCVDRAGLASTYEERIASWEEGVTSTTGRWALVQGSKTDPQATLYRLVGDRGGGQRLLLRLDGGKSLRLVEEDGREVEPARSLVLSRVEPRAAAAPRRVSESATAPS
jgi:hypothetical protein